MSDSAKSTARVRFTVEYSDCATWGKDCPVGQVWDQARSAALLAFQNVLRESGLNGSRFTVVSPPEVIAVLVPERKS